MTKRRSYVKPTPRSPKRGDTIAMLRRLQADNWVNPDTGLEINEGEGEVRLMELEQRRADRELAATLRGYKTRDKEKPAGLTPESCGFFVDAAWRGVDERGNQSGRRNHAPAELGSKGTI